MQYRLIYTRFAQALVWLVFAAETMVLYFRFSKAVLPDAVAYLSVTEKLLAGHWADTVNGYWSPLVSWLLLPFCAAGIPGILAFQILNLLLAVFCLYIIGRLLKHYRVQLPLQIALLCGAATLLPYWALRYLTADLLFLTLLLLYTWLLVSNRFYRPFIITLVGSGLYLAKAYGLPFFAAHQLLLMGYRYRQKKSIAPRPVLMGVAGVALVCGLWVLLISRQYGHFTISEAGPYNRSIVRSGAIIHPCDTLGLLPILPGEKYFAWDEMTKHVNYPVAPITAAAIGSNTKTLAVLLMKIPRYGLAVLVLLLAAVWVLRKNPPAGIFIPLSALLVFCAGYCLVFVEERYLLFPILLLLLLATICLQQLLAAARPVWQWLAALAIAYIAIRPVADGYRFTNLDDEKNSAMLAQQLKVVPAGARYATWHPYRYAPLAYYNKWIDMGGLIGYGNNDAAMRTALREYRVNYVIAPVDMKLPGWITDDYRRIYLDVEKPQVQVWWRLKGFY